MELGGIRLCEGISCELNFLANFLSCILNLLVLGEPGVVQDNFQVTTLRSFLLEQSFAEIDGILADFFPRVEREVSWVLNGLSGDLLVVIVIERKDTRKEKVRDDTDGPEINFLAVRLLEQNFRGDIRKGTEGIG